MTNSAAVPISPPSRPCAPLSLPLVSQLETGSTDSAPVRRPTSASVPDSEAASRGLAPCCSVPVPVVWGSPSASRSSLYAPHSSPRPSPLDSSTLRLPDLPPRDPTVSA